MSHNCLNKPPVSEKTLIADVNGRNSVFEYWLVASQCMSKKGSYR